MEAYSSVSKYKFKKTLEALATKVGRGTELISLYIPPGRRIYEVLASLREEFGTAANIKSRTTRKNVQEAIDKVIQRLKLVEETPPNGLIIFAGAVVQNGPGTEKMEMYVLEPPEPIDLWIYRCDDHFYLDPLYDLLQEKEVYGIVVIDAAEAVIATLKGRRIEVVQEHTSGVGGKTRKGGQSARRYERIREQELNEYFKRVGAHINEAFGQIPGLKGIIIGGPGPTKLDFVQGDYINYMLKGKIVATVDTSYVGARGVEEVFQKSQDILRNVRYVEEKKLIQRFLYEVGHETGLAVYGPSEVLKHLRAGMVDILLISENLTMLHLTIRCKTCGHEEEAYVQKQSLPAFEKKLLSTACPKCGNPTLATANLKELIDEVIDLAESFGARAEVISADTEEGTILKDGFGGLGAVLRYKASWPAVNRSGPS